MHFSQFTSFTLEMVFNHFYDLIRRFVEGTWASNQMGLVSKMVVFLELLILVPYVNFAEPDGLKNYPKNANNIVNWEFWVTILCPINFEG